MKPVRVVFSRLLLLSVRARLAGAVLIVAALWAGYFWATAKVGGA